VTLVPFAFPHRRALFVLLGLLVAAGVHAAFSSSRSIYPRVSFARIAVVAERGEQPVRGMLVSVTRRLEQSVAATPGLTRVRSKTVRGVSELSLAFEPRADMPAALSLVRARVAEAGLPAETHLTIEQQTPAVFPVISFNVVPGPSDAPSAVARARLAEWAETQLKPRLARLEDAFFVSVQSGDRREYVFEADPVRLAQEGIGIESVKDAIERANVVEAVGRAPTEGLEYQLLVDGQTTEPRQILDLAVARDAGPPARLAELGRLVETSADRTMIVTGGGEPGVVVSVFLRDGGKVTRLSEDVASVIGDARLDVPGGGSIAMVYDQATLVNDAVDGVRDAILIGAALAVVVLAVFIGNWRITLVAGLAIPLSVVLTLALFPLIGESLNLMSLGGLAVAIGLVIDDAIVVCENVARRLALGGETPFDAIAHGTSEVVGAIVGSSLTTVMVFAPLGLLEGVSGQFFRSLAIALGVSVLASMVVSLVYSPLMLLLPGLAPRSGVRTRRWMERMQSGYARLLRAFLAAPRLVALALLVVVLVGGAALTGMPTGFLPEMDEGGFVLDYALPVGSSLHETDAVCRRIERIVLATPEVTSLSRRTGAELGFFATEQFRGDMLVGLKPRKLRDRSVFEVIDELRGRLARQTPQAEVEFIQVMQDTINDLAGNPDPIEVKLFGEDYAKLQRDADHVETTIEKVRGVVDVKNHVSFGSPETTWRVEPAAAGRLGLSTQDVATQVGAQLLGEVATRVQEADRMVDVRVRYPDSWRAAGGRAAEDLSLFVGPLPGAAAPSVAPLAAVACVSRNVAENELERENQTPMVRVTASVAGRDLGSAERAVENAVRALPRDASVRVDFGGQAKSQKAAFANLVTVFSLALGLVFLLLVVQFRSLSLPLVILLALPFGQIGALHALRVAGVSLNLSSGMGLILLVGLVVKNGIILIEYAQQLRREGRDEVDAIVEAARVRLRPILMTTLAAIAGLVPLLFGGAGSELQRPLAIAVIGGLAVSTVFTLVAVPVGCALFARGRLVEGALREA
jgi:CzcA family heavy metal efflux pump